jgi:hypothetical protein
MWMILVAALAVTIAVAVRVSPGPAADGVATGGVVARAVVQVDRDRLMVRGDFVRGHGVLALQVRVQNHRARPASLRVDGCGRMTTVGLYSTGAGRRLRDDLQPRALDGRGPAPCRAGGSTRRLAPGGSVSERWELSPHALAVVAPHGARVEIAAAEHGRPALLAGLPASSLVVPPHRHSPTGR